jgi:hypothetical protein
MPLSASHESRPIERPITLSAEAATPRDVLARLYALRQGEAPSSPGAALFDERSSAFALDAFARRHMHVRDDLAWRAARGEVLSQVERATLRALDGVLDSVEPGPAPLSAEVQDILRDVLRR